MKNFLPVAFFCTILLAFVACETTSPGPDPSSQDPTIMPTPTPEPIDVMPTPEPSPTPDPLAIPTPTPTPMPSNVGQLPYGIPVPGKPGFVQSPHSMGQGYVDVRGFPPNTEVTDPYSGKPFLVP